MPDELLFFQFLGREVAREPRLTTTRQV